MGSVDEDFFLTLPSSASYNIFDNSLASFTVRLDNVLHLEHDNYEVSLVDILFHTKVANIIEETSGLDIISLTHAGTDSFSRATVKNEHVGDYETIQAIKNKNKFEYKPSASKDVRTAIDFYLYRDRRSEPSAELTEQPTLNMINIKALPAIVEDKLYNEMQVLRSERDQISTAMENNKYHKEATLDLIYSMENQIIKYDEEINRIIQLLIDDRLPLKKIEDEIAELEPAKLVLMRVQGIQDLAQTLELKLETYNSDIKHRIKEKEIMIREITDLNTIEYGIQHVMNIKMKNIRATSDEGVVKKRSRLENKKMKSVEKIDNNLARIASLSWEITVLETKILQNRDLIEEERLVKIRDIDLLYGETSMKAKFLYKKREEKISLNTALIRKERELDGFYGEKKNSQLLVENYRADINEAVSNAFRLQHSLQQKDVEIEKLETEILLHNPEAIQTDYDPVIYRRYKENRTILDTYNLREGAIQRQLNFNLSHISLTSGIYASLEHVLLEINLLIAKTPAAGLSIIKNEDGLIRIIDSENRHLDQFIFNIGSLYKKLFNTTKNSISAHQINTIIHNGNISLTTLTARIAYIYCNICRHNIIGDVHGQLLRAIALPVDSVIDHGSILFNDAHYIPIHQNIIQDIKIEIRDVEGSFLAFTGGEITVRLHIRKRGK
jgi:hypothetical protein